MKIEYGSDGKTSVQYISGAKIDEIIVKKDSDGKKYYYIRDGLNSVRLVVDERGAVVQRMDYDAFGEIQKTKDGKQLLTTDETEGSPIEASGLTTVLGFTGREYDSETGLYFYRARYYSPDAGRFLSEDPIGILGGMNLYAYCGSNPVNWIDPLGLTEKDIQDAYEWILINYPEVAEGTEPAFVEVNLPGDAMGMALPGDVILIDPNYESMDWLVNTVAHELMHVQKDFLENVFEDILTGGQSHRDIYEKAEQIRREYERQQEEKELCK